MNQSPAKTILFIHDRADICQYYEQKVAKQLNCEVIVSDENNVDRVISRLTKKPDLVITDSALGNTAAHDYHTLVHGRDIVEKLKKNECNLPFDTSDIPAIIVTGLPNRGDDACRDKYKDVYVVSSRGLECLEGTSEQQALAQTIDDLIHGREPTKIISQPALLKKFEKRLDEKNKIDPWGRIENDRAYLQSTKNNENNR